MRKQYPPIQKTRRESFGALIFCEKPGFVAHVNTAYADTYQIEKKEDATYCEGIYSAPLDAHFALTTRCNLYCKGCYNTCKKDAPWDVSLEKAKAVIDNLSKLGVFSISFGGGEPTLHPDLFEIAEYARSQNILPNITTNGRTMTKDFAQKCNVFGNVHFSIHTLQDQNYVMEAIKHYRRETGNKPGLNLLLTAEILPHAKEIVRTAAKAGVKRVLYLRYKKTWKNSQIEHLDIENSIDKLPELFRSIKKENNKIMFLYDCSLFEVLEKHQFMSHKQWEKYDGNGCMGANAYIAIDCNGRYKPCSFWKETMGDAAALTYQEWNRNEALNQFRESCTGRCKLIT